MKGLTINEERVQQGDQTIKNVTRFYNKLFEDDKSKNNQMTKIKYGDIAMVNEQDSQSFCQVQDVMKCIAECNLNKAKGQDGFDGKILSKSESMRKIISDKIVECLNTGSIPQYLKKGRLILLSKIQGDQCPDISNTRPIVVNSHLKKQSKRLL
ncbi:hypothetical protein OXYTRIMIC_092 [Oxytricha trifallax]|uniref:Uncharacterized protein n=1 Tax=Oxytricha trifallax TaxID=1172189 RepID=A0A073HZ52_9SPIT|nr:hypothetical protein OXYTRIMIC_092 [Oxytricha trifallax]